MTRVDSPVPLMHHDPHRSWITDPNSDHPKGTHPNIFDAILDVVSLEKSKELRDESSISHAQYQISAETLRVSCSKNIIFRQK